MYMQFLTGAGIEITVTVFSVAVCLSIEPVGILKLAEIIPDPKGHSCWEPIYTVGEEQTKLRICKCKIN